MRITVQNVIRNLTFWVLIAISAGIVMGLTEPEKAVQMEFLGKGFISVVKLFINLHHLPYHCARHCCHGRSEKVGRTGGKAILYFEIVTSLALIIGITVAHVLQPGRGVDTSKANEADVSLYVQKAQAFSWLQFFKDNLTLQVLVVAIITGILLSLYDKTHRVIKPLTVVSKYVFIGLHIVMYAAPIGAFGGMAFTVGKFGPSALLSLAKLMGSVYLTMIIFIFGVLGPVLWMYRIRIWDFLKYIRKELLIVLGTSSSEAGLPSLMEKLEAMGCAKPVVGLTVPAGYSFNLDGTTIYLSMACIFLAQAYNVHLSPDKGYAAYRRTAANVQGSSRCYRQRLYCTGLNAAGAECYTGGRPGPADRCGSLHVRSSWPYQQVGNGVATVWLANHEKAFDRTAMERAFAEVNQ